MRGIAPRAGPIAVLHHVLWFLTVWHLVTVWIWAWNGTGNEAAMKLEEVGDVLTACGAVCGAGLEVRAVSGAEGELVDMWMDREGGFACVRGGAMLGGQGGEVQ